MSSGENIKQISKMPLLVVEVFQSANCLLRNYFLLISSSVIWAEEWLHY